MHPLVTSPYHERVRLGQRSTHDLGLIELAGDAMTTKGGTEFPSPPGDKGDQANRRADDVKGVQRSFRPLSGIRVIKQAMDGLTIIEDTRVSVPSRG